MPDDPARVRRSPPLGVLWFSQARAIDRPNPVGERALVTAAAGTRLAAVVGRLEAVTTATGGDSVRIVDGEPGAHQAIHVVHLAASDITGAHFIHQQADAIHFHHGVAFLLLLQRHAVPHDGTSHAGPNDAPHT